MSPPNNPHSRKSTSASIAPRELMGQDKRLVQVWKADVITLFPDSFPGVLGQSLTGRALSAGKWALSTTDLRLFGEGKHKNVDDTPAGGRRGNGVAR